VSLSPRFLSPAQAGRRLGVSAKALRLYEQRGLLSPVRAGPGWRTYGPEAMARAAEIVALRALGLSLAEVARVSGGDTLEPALAAHQAMLEARIRQIAGAREAIRGRRRDLARGEMHVAFDLPWPWGGERFELRDIRAMTYIIGPLGSGKTRLALRLAETLPNAAYLGLDRSAAAEPALKARVDQTLAGLVEDGAVASDALVALLVGLAAEGPAALVVDMVEQGLDQLTQKILIAHLRRRGSSGRPLFLLTRSCAILDLAAVGAEEAIILCPANHSPPTLVAPYPGAPGYEAVATCLASTEVRARTEGVIAWRPRVA
jgi:DNA-binding transcriptional MerR regulator